MICSILSIDNANTVDGLTADCIDIMYVISISIEYLLSKHSRLAIVSIMSHDVSAFVKYFEASFVNIDSTSVIPVVFRQNLHLQLRKTENF